MTSTDCRFRYEIEGLPSYEGFDVLVFDELEQGDQVVIAYPDGEPELWMVNGKEGIDSLRRMYVDDFVGEEVKFLILDLAP